MAEFGGMSTVPGDADAGCDDGFRPLGTTSPLIVDRAATPRFSERSAIETIAECGWPSPGNG